jgi:hypothetical protein
VPHSSPLLGLTTFVFNDITAPFPGFPQRPFVFNDIPGSFVQKSFSSDLPSTFGREKGRSVVCHHLCSPLLELTTFVFNNIPATRG